MEKTESVQVPEKKRTGNFFGSFGEKCLIVFVMVLVLQIPILLIKNLVRDRKSYRDTAFRSILLPKGGEPNFEGILEVIPYKEMIRTLDENGKVMSTTHVRRNLFVTPDLLDEKAEISTEILKRGIFNVSVFSFDLNMKGGFSGIEDSSVMENYVPSEDEILWDEAMIIMGISNKKNLTAIPEITVNGEKIEQSLFDRNVSTPFSNNIYYNIGSRARTGFSFEVIAGIQGGESVSFTPLAGENRFSVSSDWKTPGFRGGWLPLKRTLDDKGFSAEWSIPGLSTNFSRRWTDSTSFGKLSVYDTRIDGTDINSESINVSFYQPVDNYQKAERSVKYSILFILVPFIALLVFEVFAKIRIHPVQYALIGLANIVFYLLLLSITEHLDFNLTYWIASTAVSALLFLYGSSVFRRMVYGLVFALVNFVSYVFLFGTLQAEDYALLIGSIGIFFIICLLMILTRKIDWYKLQESYMNGR